jgi:5-(carboxyamino)imidazole ribonucleotide synthase
MKIGILGGGQLAKMMAEAAQSLGIDIICIDPDITCSAKTVAKVHHYHFSDINQIKEILAGVDYVTYETENLPIEPITELSKIFEIYPNIDALKITQDRLFEKQLFTSLEIPTPDYFPVNSWDDLNNALTIFGSPTVLKTRRNGYDGKGQAIISNRDDAQHAWDTLLSNELILEEFIQYDFEVSLIGARDKAGNISFYPLTLNEHKNGILRLSQAPYINESLETQAREYTTKIMSKLNYVGVMTVEFFCVNGLLRANEIAPRVHNSGHWTIDGADTSQFENHLRAVAGLPLGPTKAINFSAMFNCIGHEPKDIDSLLKIDGLHYHSYGKAPRINRKLGHVTICMNSRDKFTAEFRKKIEVLL